MRQRLLAGLPRPLPPSCRLPRGYTLDVVTERTVCEDCGTPLRVQRSPVRRPFGVALGEPCLRHRVRTCPLCGRAYRCEEFDALVPPGGNYAFDVIVEIGLDRFRHHRQSREIVERIADEHGRAIPPGAVHHLSGAFLDGVAAVHEERSDDIAALLAANGGWVCHLDGTCEADTEVLFAVIDGITGIVLDTARVPTENAKDIRQVVDRCVERFGQPLAVMRDLSSNIESAVAHLPESVRHFVCQYHFLENVGEALTAEHHVELTKRLRKARICPRLKSLRCDLVRYSRAADPITALQIEQLLDGSMAPTACDPIQLRRCIAYLLLRWLDDYRAELGGERFPFDLPSLALHRRCAALHRMLRDLLARQPDLVRAHPTLGSILDAIAPAVDDPAVVDAATRLRKAADVFAELRDALRFRTRDGNPVRRDRAPHSPPEDARHAEARLAAFRDRMQNRARKANRPETRKDAKTVLDYIDRYRDKLSGHCIELPGERPPLLVDRTNAICERCFGATKAGWRRRLGTKKLVRQMRAARHEELLVANLENKHYLRALYQGTIDNLAERFGSVAAKAQRNRAERRNQVDKRPIPVTRKILRRPGIIGRVANMLRRAVACFA